MRSRARRASADEPPVYLPEGMIFLPGRGTVVLSDGKHVDLRPKTAAVFRVLAERDGHVVSREELVDLVWPDVAVTDDSITQCVVEIRRALGKVGSNLLRTLPKRGYLLDSQANPQTAESNRTPHAADSLPRLAIVPSLAVLPFAALDGASYEYFADGMTEEIILSLSRLRWLFVIARNSSFIYKRRAVDVRVVGRQLGVRYVLEGSVRKSGDRVRITCRLLQAENAHEVWTNSFDGSLAQVFELQEQVAAAVAGAIEPKLRQAEIERARRKPTDSLDAYDLYLRALPHHYGFTSPGNEQAEHLLRQALQQDPAFAAAKALLADVQMRRYSDGVASRGEQSEGIRLARSVLRSDTEDPVALSYAGLVLLVLDHAHPQARVALERAIGVNPNSAQVLNHAGWVWTFCCEGQRATAFFEQAIRVSPRDLAMPNFLAGLTYAHLIEGHYDEAVAAAHRGADQAPQFGLCLRGLIAAMVMAGKPDEARLLAVQLEGAQPGYRCVNAQRTAALFLNQTFSSRLIAAYRTAGLEE